MKQLSFFNNQGEQTKKIKVFWIETESVYIMSCFSLARPV